MEQIRIFKDEFVNLSSKGHKFQSEVMVPTGKQTTNHSAVF